MTDECELPALDSASAVPGRHVRGASTSGISSMQWVSMPAAARPEAKRQARTRSRPRLWHDLSKEKDPLVMPIIKRPIRAGGRYVCQRTDPGWPPAYY